jgi:hypothetical protein
MTQKYLDGEEMIEIGHLVNRLNDFSQDSKNPDMWIFGVLSVCVEDIEVGVIRVMDSEDSKTPFVYFPVAQGD